MTTPINDGGTAFPRTGPYPADNARGMSLRDWFAGQALSLASKLEHDDPTGSEGQPTYTGIATRAYYMADAMIAARNKKD